MSKKLQDQLTIHDETEGGRQIPEVTFIDNVEELCAKSGHDATDYVSFYCYFSWIYNIGLGVALLALPNF